MKRTSLALVAVAGLLVAAPTFAGTAQFGIGGFAGYNTYSMNDVNDDISSTNDFFGTSIDEMNGGIGFGGGLRVRTSPSLSFSLDYERLNSSTSASGTDGTTTFNVDLDLPANAFVAGVTYLFPSASKARFGVTGGIGYYSADGKLELTADDGVNSVTLVGDASGNGVGFHAGGAVDVAMSSVAHFEAMAGYRVAKTGNLEVDGTEIPDYAAEWSGFMSRAGFSFFFGSH
ncbi:MAG TPA: outer membrane beta-barrel protein [Candidatus Eisenbacteria bacterium]|nr:outer membrane beta-barrel protein [Candidatus Eisenbacteria bacterium]